jgi:hypothetical protein
LGRVMDAMALSRSRRTTGCSFISRVFALGPTSNSPPGAGS